MEIANKVKDILSELSGMKEIDPQKELKGDLGLDSFQMITLLIMLEESFQIVLDESDMNPFDLINVCDVTNLVEKYVGGENSEKTEEKS